MAPLGIALVSAAATAAIMTPVTRRIARRLGAVDHEDARRTHRGTTPRLGGVPLAMGATVGVACAWIGSSPWSVSDPRCWGLLGGAAIMLGLGIYDDIRNVRPRFKLAVQLVAAGCAYLAGVRIAAIDLPLAGTIELGWLALPITMLWLVGVTNAINLLDGIDGLAAGVTIVAAVSFLLIGATTGTPEYVVIGAGATIGACAVMGLQTLRRDHKLFLGDSGSLLLGFMLANLALLACKKMTGAISPLPACIALGLPLMDTLASIVRRILLRRSPFSPDRGHIHHALLSMGMSKRGVVVVLCGLSIVYGLTALGMASTPGEWSLFAFPCILIFPGYVYWRRGYLSPRAWLGRWRLERTLRNVTERLQRAETPERMTRLAGHLMRLMDLEYLCLHRGEPWPEGRERRQPLVRLGNSDATKQRMIGNQRFGNEATIVLHQRVGDHPLTPDLHEVLSSPVVRMLVRRATVLRSRESRVAWIDRDQTRDTAPVAPGPDTRVPDRSRIGTHPTESPTPPREVPCRS